MDNEIKLQKYYDGAKMRRAVMLMEQYWALSQDKNLDEANRICAKKMYEHFKRLALCIVAKEMPEDANFGMVIDVDYMKNMYRGYTQGEEDR